MDISVQELKTKLENKEDFVLIDVREPHEHEEFNVGGSLYPVGDLPNKVDQLSDQKEAEVVVYCRSGGRSGMAQTILQGAGFKNVRNLTGGMLAWVDTFGTTKPG
ncbi:MAG: rhodanese-like domain-containing protein [Bacteroidota bacterium]